MTKLEAIEKIRKLPELKDGYGYYISMEGGVFISGERMIWKATLYTDFFRFFKNIYTDDIEKYKDYFAKPIYKNDKIVGYE